MKEQFYSLLEENGKVINDDKISVTFNDNSIEIMQIDDEGYNLYGETFYSAESAYDRIKQLGALE